jgi:hypothetical protein
MNHPQEERVNATNESPLISTKTEIIGDPSLALSTSCENVIAYTTEVLTNLKDGDTVTFVYHQGSQNKTNRIDLTKGLTISEESTEKSSTLFTLNGWGWKGWGLLMLFAIPWGIGMNKISYYVRPNNFNLTKIFSSKT